MYGLYVYIYICAIYFSYHELFLSTFRCYLSSANDSLPRQIALDDVLSMQVNETPALYVCM